MNRGLSSSTLGMLGLKVGATIPDPFHLEIWDGFSLSYSGSSLDRDAQPRPPEHFGSQALAAGSALEMGSQKRVGEEKTLGWQRGGCTSYEYTNWF